MVSGKLPPRKYPPMKAPPVKITPQNFSHEKIAPCENPTPPPWENYPQ